MVLQCLKNATNEGPWAPPGLGGKSRLEALTEGAPIGGIARYHGLATTNAKWVVPEARCVVAV
jgi:hypothetical protein